MSYVHAELSRAYSPLGISALFRQEISDFKVEEVLSFTPCGSGIHSYLKIRKEDINTEQVVQYIARSIGISSGSIGYAGLKDKRAIATQWFSIDMSRVKDINWDAFGNNNIRIKLQTRHGRKLRRGAIRENRFDIFLRSVSGDHNEIMKRIERISSQGVPNYFGEQRFGSHNLDRALSMFDRRTQVKSVYKRGIYLSAARSMLFNQVLSERIKRYGWNKAMNGDVLMLNGTNSVFSTQEIDEEIHQRLQHGDIHLTGPMWGSGKPMVSREGLAFELEVLNNYQKWCKGLQQFGLRQQRRALRVIPKNFRCEFTNKNLVRLSFHLPKGSYATSVLREIADYNQIS
ncbi:MAG: tRNA pseudouridine(13) synthase TruD [Gammaproteobacteria bacterium]